MARRNINWDEIKRAYIYGIKDKKTGGVTYPAYRDLEKMFNVSLRSVARKAKEGNWIVEKEMVQNRINKQINKKKEEIMVDENITFSKDCFNISKGLLKILGNKLIDKENNKLNEKLPTIEARRIMETVQMIQNVGIKALEGTSDNKSAIDELVNMFKSYWEDDISTVEEMETLEDLEDLEEMKLGLTE